MFNISRPTAVVVSKFSLMLWKPTPTISQADNVSCMCLTDLNARSNLNTRTVLNLFLAASSSSSRHAVRCTRSLAGALLTYSRWTSIPLALTKSRSAISWVSGSWSLSLGGHPGVEGDAGQGLAAPLDLPGILSSSLLFSPSWRSTLSNSARSMTPSRMSNLRFWPSRAFSRLSRMVCSFDRSASHSQQDGCIPTA